MKANEFVKKYGLEEAKNIICLQDSPVYEVIWDIKNKKFKNDNGFTTLLCETNDNFVFVPYLKRLVESHELVNEFFNLEALGFDKAIELAKKQIEELEDNETVEFWHRWDDDLSCTVARMKQAIADVESCQ